MRIRKPIKEKLKKLIIMMKTGQENKPNFMLLLTITGKPNIKVKLKKWSLLMRVRHENKPNFVLHLTRIDS